MFGVPVHAIAGPRDKTFQLFQSGVPAVQQTALILQGTWISHGRPKYCHAVREPHSPSVPGLLRAELLVGLRKGLDHLGLLAPGIGRH